MKNIFIKTVLLALVFSSTMGTAVARECTTCKKTSIKKTAIQRKAAVCKRAQSTAELNVNNVRALINGYGNMWYDGSISQYHIPKDGSSTPLYCAALWIGGTDVNDQLRLAALRFGQNGDDYWPGPLTRGTADVSIEVCNWYDRHWKINQVDVSNFMQMFDYTTNPPTQNESYDEAAIAQVIKEWPAHGNFADQSPYLAPFYDADGDGVYNYQKGDYPYYDFDNALCPRTLKAALKPGEIYRPFPTMEDSTGIVEGGLLSDQVLKGDQTIWWVFNDMGNTHTESGGQPIGLEIRAQAFAFSTNDDINNMTFYSYEIINRSTYELRNTYFSQWVDPDLGYGYDDFIGCDVKRGLGYCYNGKDVDGPGTGAFTGVPPAVGIDFFQGPYMDPDGLDNPKIDIQKMRDNYPEKLAQYTNPDGTINIVRLTDDADLYYPLAWHFTPNDSVGNCAINGVNFGNDIVDDERFGMRRFVYYENSTSNINGEPSKATDYYNYLQGFWKNGQHMKFGGNAISNGTSDINCDFMFPGNSDELFWGTNGVVPDAQYHPTDWTEVTSGENVSPGDRRFMQSAGPFTLKPGAVNYITVGIPFAQAPSGNAWTSVEILREIDDVCQALFENCFKVLDGPDAPTMIAQEMSNEIVLYLTYENPNSNNYNEKYDEQDASILQSYPESQRHYKFEGYQIYQLVDANASIADINDESKARLVAQCDVENYYALKNAQGFDSIDPTTGEPVVDPNLPIGTLVNYTTNSATNLLTGRIMVQGANAGIKHVFRVTTDQFASGTNKTLVNNKEYYFICVAYAHNRFKEYSQTDPSKLDGQKEPYLAGRKNEFGGTITPVVAKPHDPSSENGGTVVQATFGMSPNITRYDGSGNGGNILKLTDESINELMSMPPGVFSDRIQGNNYTWSMSTPCVLPHPRYEQNAGPINVRVIDPLNVKEGQFYIKFDGTSDSSKWVISKVDGTPLYDDVYSDTADFVISRYNEQLFLDLGLSVAITNPGAIASDLVVSDGSVNGGIINDGTLLSSSMTFNDNNHQWFSSIPDNDIYPHMNWIRSGSQYAQGNLNNFLDTIQYTGNEPYLDDDYYKVVTEIHQTADGRMIERSNVFAVDKSQTFEKVLSGTWAPYGLVSTRDYHPGFSLHYFLNQSVIDSLHSVKPRTYKHNYYDVQRSLMNHMQNKSLMFNDMSRLPSVRVVITSDTSKWTRCPVLEMCDDYTQSEGNARRFQIRKHASIDKNGDTATYTGESNDPGSPNYISDRGMGWFPGYAINLATGERLNIMYGEDSRYAQFNGRDMMWNPVSTDVVGTQNYIMGGRHYIYVMNAMTQTFPRFHRYDENYFPQRYGTPSYDAGRWAVRMLRSLDHLLSSDFSDNTGKMVIHNGLLVNEAQPYALPMRDSAAFLFSTVAWVNMPLVTENINNPKNIPTDVTIDLNVNVRYSQYLGDNHTTPADCSQSVNNNNNPMYMFELTPDIVTLTGQATRADASQDYKDSIMNAINVVPNPYYSYSTYETASQLETKVRFINVPGNTTINIYTLDGTLVRSFPSTPDNTTTYDWDLHNHNGIPIAGGIYLIHFSTPGVGERVVKWFGTMRPVDLNSFQF